MVAGGIAYLVIQLAGALFLEVPVSVPVLVIGTVGACLICYVLQLFVFGGDYSRSKMFRFQDDEYYYYVKDDSESIPWQFRKRRREKDTAGGRRS